MKHLAFKDLLHPQIAVSVENQIRTLQKMIFFSRLTFWDLNPLSWQ